MYKPSSNCRQASFFWDLETMLDSKHQLFKPAYMVDWSLFENSFAPLFCRDNGRPPKPIRLMVGLLKRDRGHVSVSIAFEIIFLNIPAGQ